MNLLPVHDQIADVLDYVLALEALGTAGKVQILTGTDVSVLLSRISLPLTEIKHTIEQMQKSV